MFDDNPAVARAFSPPNSAYTDPRKSDRKRGTPLPPLALIEAGKVLALTFPIGLNPGLTGALGVMLKLDCQPGSLWGGLQGSTQPRRTWRDLLFVYDEYHTFLFQPNVSSAV